LPRRVEGGWLIGGYHYEENPRWTTPGWAISLAQRWGEMQRMQRAGLGAAVLLPAAGGYLDQPAGTMEAFALFDGWAAERSQGHAGA
jgi:hypothetical protein